MTDCTKCVYPTPWHASRALKAIQNKSGSREGKMPRRIYFCTACGGWHLTSMAKSEIAWLRKSAGRKT
jgi:hypothetical protein